MENIPNTENPDLTQPIGARDHTQGSENAPITLVQYGDYECPYTRKSNAVVKDIQARLGDQVRFVFRNFPLFQIHPHAAQAARAAEAAAALGQFWPMHDLLFSNQHNLETTDLTGYAQTLGLEAAAFEEKIRSQAVADHIQEDVEGGSQSGVQGTPTFFVNGQLVESWDEATLMSAIERYR